MFLARAVVSFYFKSETLMKFDHFLDIIREILTWGSFKIRVWEDRELIGFTNYQMQGNFVKVSRSDVGEAGNIDISADACLSGDKKGYYGLVLKCNVEDGCFLVDEDPLTLNIDNDPPRVFPLDRSFYKRQEVNILGSRQIIEVDRFLVPLLLIQKIANAKNISFFVKGTRKTIEGYFLLKNIHRFKRFCERYLALQ